MPTRLNIQVARRLLGAAERFDRIARAPERVLHVGSGNFLRAFSGWMIDHANRRDLFNGRIVVAQATPHSRVTRALNEQDGCFTVLQRGLRDGRPAEQIDLVTAVSRALNPYTDWAEFLQTGSSRALRFIVSNTTEAGITYAETTRPAGECPASFPAKMTALLHHRFERLGGASDRGLVFLPCELIDHNGDRLRECVLRHADDWKLNERFSQWVRDSCFFLNTLVDRIVSGFPADEIEGLSERLGYDDHLLVASELYHSWIIEADERVVAAISSDFPLAEAGLNVTWTGDLQPYHTRKVRILNGAHTMLTPVALLCDRQTVRESLEDPLLARYLDQALFQEVIPALDLPAARTVPFARDVLERFRNPAIQHRLASIALNSTSKWRVRVLPSLYAHMRQRGTLPRAITFSLASLITLFRPGGAVSVQDTPEARDLLARAWKRYDGPENLSAVTRAALAERALWEADLSEIPGLAEQVTTDMDAVLREGVPAALRSALGR